ncbi:MAG: hypothetical protein AAF436_02505 [Myxococcota bacterium]
MDVAERIQEYRAMVEPVVGARRWLLFSQHVVSLGGLARRLRSLGAGRPMLVGALMGTGELLPEEEATHVLIPPDRQPADISESFRDFERGLATPPAEVQSRVDAWDPDRRAVAAAMVVLSDVPSVAGRKRFGRRSTRWGALENKVVVDEFWDRCGVARAPAQIVAAEPDALDRAARELDRGSGTVWAGDTTSYVHGGGDGTRWVRTRQDFDDVARSFGSLFQSVRVMPFVEGVPCSIHGVVFGTEIAVLRPIELVILRRPGASQFVYSGFNSYWHPGVAAATSMRDIARRVGETLRDSLDYRGPYTIDGIMTEDGFVPTELNPRTGGAMSLYSGALPEFPLHVLLWCAIEGERLHFQPSVFEELLVDALDANPQARCHTAVGTPNPFGEETKTFRFAADGDAFRLAEDGDSLAGELTVGPTHVGTYLRFSPNPVSTARGPSLAPLVCKAFEYAEATLGLPVGALRSAGHASGASRR